MKCYHGVQIKVDELGRVFGYMGKVRKAYKVLVRKLNERHYLRWHSTNGKRICSMDSCVYYQCAPFLFNFLCSINTVASKCSQNHLMCDKCKTVQSFRLHFLQNSLLMQLHYSSSNCKGAGNMAGTHFVKAFSTLPSHC